MAPSPKSTAGSWSLSPELAATLEILATGSRKTIDLVAKMRQHHPLLIPNGVDSVVSHLGLLRRMGLIGTDGTGKHSLTTEGLLAWAQLRETTPPNEDTAGGDLLKEYADLLAVRVYLVAPEGLSPEAAQSFLKTRGIDLSVETCHALLEGLVLERLAIKHGPLYYNPAHFVPR